MIRKNKGFTLIELLVVIAIIGILSSVVLASLNSARKKARDARRVADLKQVQLALEMYFDTERKYPTSLSLLVPNYLPAVPKDPLNTLYSYAALGSGDDCNSYHLGATLEQTGPLLDTDADDAGTAGVCTNGGTNFAGNLVPDFIYDIKP